MRRFTHLPNVSSNKIETSLGAASNSCDALQLPTHYNFAPVHKTPRITLAAGAGVSDHIWELEELAKLAD